jgi:cytochrome b561
MVPRGYSSTQILLHWSVALLVLVQFLGHDAIEQAWAAYRESGAVPEGSALTANFHAIIGGLIFVLAVWRVVLRFTRGVPPAPPEEPRIFRMLAAATHGLLYLLLLGMPLSGAAAWLVGIEPAGEAHSWAATLLFALVVLHLLGALAHFALFRSNVLSRMAIAED